uniref:BRCT domain-containing protein n=1 Tax=Mesocestoides corti TaxID=53468 RepID=A0A5K3EIX3_MESCO
MPEVKPERVLTFSSEDRAFPADNLLKCNAFSKWKCQQPASKQASVTFKFERPIQFSRLDIGNEASAFVEIEVSRADSAEFEVLLPSSSFMSPMEAKKAVSLNRVRIFSGNELTPSVASQKWDIVRVTCTQPFSKELQYGLSFIRFYRVPDPQDMPKEDEDRSSQDSDGALKPGDLFKLAKKHNGEQEATATTSTETKPVESKTVTQKLRENQSVLNALGTSTPPQRPTASQPPASAASPRPEPSTSQKRRRILDGVVVAFSGYKNPFRAELRDLCLRLGAQYRQEWTDDCTHLICAFPNTPKWNAVKGKGIIASHKWIQACNATKRRVSWRPYRVGRAPSPVGHVSDDNSEPNADEDSDWE